MDVKRKMKNNLLNSMIDFLISLVSKTGLANNELKRTEYLVKL